MTFKPAHRKKPALWLNGLIALLVVGALAAGGALIAGGMQTHPPKAAPVPKATFDVAPKSLTPAQIAALNDATRKSKFGIDPAAKKSGDVEGTTMNPKLAGPNRLIIPSLAVNAPIESEPIVIDPNGGGDELNIPHNVHVVGLFTQGAHPDSKAGNIIIAGHINYAGQGNGALYDLANIPPNAIIYVTDSSNRITTWQTIAINVYVKKDLPQSLFSETGPLRLNIVTCGGVIERVPNGEGGFKNSYTDNTVVTAVQNAPDLR